jgi:Na+/alanine symporter
MRWIASFGIALLTSIAAMFGAGNLAGLAVN